MTGEYFYESELYHELKELTDKLEPWYVIDKIKWYSVYVWTKDNPDNEEYPFGENSFDIWADEIVFYTEDHVIPDEAIPIIQEIQEKLKEINKCLEDE